MRSVSSPALTALAANQAALCLLVEMDLTSTVYLCSAGVNLVYAGNTWLGAARFGGIEELRDAAAERKALQLTLSSVPLEMLSVALAEPIRGKPIRIYEAIFETSTYAVLDAPMVWSGSLDQMTISEGENAGQITVTAEHRGTTFARVKPLRYTDFDQQRLYPGDNSLQFVASQSNHVDVWPAAAWFKK